MDRTASPSIEQPPIQSAPADVPSPPAMSQPSPRKTPAWMTDFVISSLPGSADSVLPHTPSVVTTISSISLSATHQALMALIENSHDPTTFSKAIQDSK